MEEKNKKIIIILNLTIILSFFFILNDKIDELNNINLKVVILIELLIFLPIFCQRLYNNYKELYKKNIYNGQNNKEERFEFIYSNMKNKNIIKLEQQRKKQMIKKIYININFIVFFIISRIFNINSNELSEIIPSYIFIILNRITTAVCYFGIPTWLIYVVMQKSEKREEYEKEYKDAILSNFIKLYDKNLSYKKECDKNETNKIKDDYIKNKFSIQAIGNMDLFEIQNHIMGQLNDKAIINLYDVAMGELIVISNSSYGQTTTKNYKFKGIYIVIDIDRTIPTVIRISENKIVKHKNNIEVDHSEFEKNFDVNSDDKVLAFRILTSDVMNMLKEFYEKYDIKFEIVFEKNKIYINLQAPEAFKIPIYNSIDKRQAYLYYAILEFTTNLSKEINKALNEIEL